MITGNDDDTRYVITLITRRIFHTHNIIHTCIDTYVNVCSLHNGAHFWRSFTVQCRSTPQFIIVLGYGYIIIHSCTENVILACYISIVELLVFNLDGAGGRNTEQPRLFRKRKLTWIATELSQVNNNNVEQCV